MPHASGAAVHDPGGESASGYDIRRASTADQPSLIRLLGRYICAEHNEARYEWLYRKNPQGWGHTWLATPAGSDQIVGFTSIFAREVAVGGELLKAGVGFD